MRVFVAKVVTRLLLAVTVRLERWVGRLLDRADRELEDALTVWVAGEEPE